MPRTDLIEFDKSCTGSFPPDGFSLPYLVVDTGEWCVISNGLKGRPSPIAISGGSHFPAELHGCLVDASLATALLHDSIPREVGVTGSDTDQWVAWRWGFLDSFLCNLFHMIIVSKGDDLGESSRALAGLRKTKTWELLRPSPRPHNLFTPGDSMSHNRKLCSSLPGKGEDTVHRGDPPRSLTILLTAFRNQSLISLCEKIH